jgi:hypothetical protein
LVTKTDHWWALQLFGEREGGGHPGSERRGYAGAEMLKQKNSGLVAIEESNTSR